MFWKLPPTPVRIFARDFFPETDNWRRHHRARMKANSDYRGLFPKRTR